MSTTTTDYLGLIKPTPGTREPIRVADLNANADTLDKRNSAVFNVMGQGIGAKGDDATDDAPAINVAITLAAGFLGGTVKLPQPPVAYRIKSRLIGKTGVTLEGDGWGTIIRADPSLVGPNGQLFYTDNTLGVTSDIAIRNLCFDGNKSAVPVSEGGGGEGSQSAIYLNQVDGVRVENVLVVNAVSNGFYVVNSSNDVVIAGCTINAPGKAGSTGGRGIVLGISPQHVRLLHNFVSGSLKHGILVQSEGGSNAQYIVIAHNTVTSAGSQGIDLTDNTNSGVSNIFLRDIEIVGNIVIGSAQEGIRLSSNVTIVNTHTTIIEEVQVHHNIVKSAGGIGVNLSVANDGQLQNVKVTDNIVEDCTGVGINVADSANLVDVDVTDNFVLRNASPQITHPADPHARGVTIRGNKTRQSAAYRVAFEQVIAGTTGYGLAFRAAQADANPRFAIRADGQIEWGAGGASATDVVMARVAANQLQIGQQLLVVDGVATKVKAGTISDADFAVAPPNGTIAIDSSTPRLYVRYGGSWHFAALT